MKNFRVAVKGKEYWVSRSIAVAVFIYSDFYVLANKRGLGTPDFQGFWCCPCGYLDYNETLEEAAAREVYEETGYVIKPDALEMFYINSNPNDSEKQNVTVRFRAKVDDLQIGSLTNKFSEFKEVAEIAWIRKSEIDKYDWAFGHKEIIKKFIFDSDEKIAFKL